MSKIGRQNKNPFLGPLKDIKFKKNTNSENKNDDIEKNFIMKKITRRGNIFLLVRKLQF